MKGKNFNPILFLASLGAGGIAVMPFAFLQYVYYKGAGLVTMSGVGHGTIPVSQELLFYSLESVMIIFTIIHLILTVVFTKRLIKWVGTKEYHALINDPLKNAGILAVFLSYTMTMNVVIGPIRYFIPWVSSNLQAMMFPAFIGWLIIYVLLLRMVIKLLRISFTQDFDVNKISFGWLLHPFSIGMVAVVGAGIAAIGNNTTLSNAAAFLTLIITSMGLFLLLVKMISIFKSHFAAKGLPEKQFMPSFLIVVPNITLYAITFFRLGHYLEKHMGYHLDYFFYFVILGSVAFQVWYLLFGLALLWDYFKRDFFRKEYYPSMWGFVCPVVAFAVLGAFAHKIYPNIVFYWTLIATMVVAVVLFFFLFRRHLGCEKGVKRIDCI